MQKNTKLAIGVVTVIVILAAAVGSYYYTAMQPKPPEPETVIRLGVTGPLTGPNADFGKFIANGVRMRVDEVNEAGGLLVAGKKYPVEMTLADDESKVEKGITAMEKLVTISKVHAIVGGYHSSIIVASCEIPQKYNIPFIDSGAMSIKIAEKIRDKPLPLVFQLSKTVVSEGNSVAQALVQLKWVPNNKVALITQDSDYGRGDSEYFRKWLSQNAPQVQVVLEEFIPTTGMIDWVPVLTKIKASDATWVGATPTGLQSVSLFQAWSELGLKDKIRLHDFNGEIQKIIPEKDWDKITYCTGTVLLAAEKFQKTTWATKFQEKFRYYPAEHDAQAYDSATAMLWAIEKAGTFTDAAKIAAALEQIDIAGVSGRIKFTSLKEGHVRTVSHMIMQYMPRGSPKLLPVVWPESEKEQTYIWPPPA